MTTKQVGPFENGCDWDAVKVATLADRTLRLIAGELFESPDQDCGRNTATENAFWDRCQEIGIDFPRDSLWVLMNILHDAALVTLREIGIRIGRAIANDVLANDDYPREWTGIDDQDGDQLTAAGIEFGTPEWKEAEDTAEETYTAIVVLVGGCQVRRDASGAGHCWRDVYAADLPGEIRQEIECEIASGNESCGNYVASNGRHYRW